MVTRPAAQAGGFFERLEQLGAVPLSCPTIRIEPPDSTDDLDAALGRFDTYDWVVFTSANAVRAVAERMHAGGWGVDRLNAVRIAAVGPATLRTLQEHGIWEAIAPDDGASEKLARSLSLRPVDHVLLPRGDLADARLPGDLRRLGAEVTEVVAYRTVPVPPPPDAIRALESGVDAITFTSGSTVEGFQLLGPQWRELIQGAIVATIGPATSAAARKAGLIVHVEAGERSIESVIDALIREFDRTGS